MSITSDRKQSVDSESAVLVGVKLAQHDNFDEDLEELTGLVETAGAEIVGRVTQRRQAPDPATYVGHGKVEEIAAIVEATDADVVIFDNDLAPGQGRNLEKAFGVKVLDRTEVILDIFSTRAQTHEARLAVELAQLEYSLPRLKRMWTHLSRMKMGVGMRGPGEKQLETDLRLVERRITELRRELDRVLKRKEREVAARRDRMTVSLVGYTNAGKSTLLNRLTDASVLAEDKLFATLDTRTRRWMLPGWGPVLLSDTVGFIRDLPHELIASFKATLEEARQADLLLHVADASNPAALEQIKSVYGVLAELGIEEKDTVLVLNKVDRLDDPARLEALRGRYPNAVPISAHTGEGVHRVAGAVSDALSHDFLDLEVSFDAANGKLLATLAQYGDVLSRTFTEDRAVVHVRLARKYLGRVQEHADATVRPHPAAESRGRDAAHDEDAPIGDVA
ncbi:MAG: GTPase HflX [Planctomycetaceae bacterium]|nr:GTPase HflX [Planctomycetaceae bacterium]